MSSFVTSSLARKMNYSTITRKLVTALFGSIRIILKFLSKALVGIDKLAN